MPRRSTATLSVLLFIAACLPASAQQSLETALNGREVVLKIDMPGTQKGVDLSYNKQTPMDWKEYGKRIKQFGPAIHKGDTVRITAVVRKKDTIEIQFNGGGFGTFGDDTRTSIDPKQVDKSDYEKQLERDISNTDDEDRRRQLRRDLDRERTRRDRENDANRRDAQIASQIQSVKVADNRAGGGSRFNLRWSGSIPAELATPDSIERLLADYVDFQTGASITPEASAAAANPAPSPSGSSTDQLKRGMSMTEVATLLGPNHQLSESTAPDGLKTQIEEYTTADQRIQVTFVNSIVVRYTISSH